MSAERRLVTIGVYGYQENTFFQALRDAGVDTFVDIRGRRGMRGSAYAFANSARLQQRLRELGITYRHAKELAPPQDVRERQQQEDRQLGVTKRARTALSPAFVTAYEQTRLADLDSSTFVAGLGMDAWVICLFCVEREPGACHRSLSSQVVQVRTFHMPVEAGLPFVS